MAHSPKHCTEMGRLVVDAGKRDWDELTTEYGAMLMEGLSVMGTRGKHVSVLQHIMGFLRIHLSSEDTPQAKRSKQEFLGLIEDYRQGLLPLIVPLALLKHHLNRNAVPDWVPVPFGYSTRCEGTNISNSIPLFRRKLISISPREAQPPAGHLPWIPNAGTMYEALGQALPGRAFDPGLCRGLASRESLFVGPSALKAAVCMECLLQEKTMIAREERTSCLTKKNRKLRTIWG